MSYFKCSKRFEKKLDALCGVIFSLIRIAEDEHPDNYVLNSTLRNIGNFFQDISNGVNSGDPEDE